MCRTRRRWRATRMELQPEPEPESDPETCTVMVAMHPSCGLTHSLCLEGPQPLLVSSQEKEERTAARAN